MAGNPREHVRDRGFWDGGKGHGRNSDTAGRAGGFPGTRIQKNTGIRTDLFDPTRVTTSDASDLSPSDRAVPRDEQSGTGEK